jgi:nitroreductase
MRARRSVRDFDPSGTVDDRIIKTCVESALQAPSGANRQPWHFVVIGDSAMKAKLREAAEAVEREFYSAEKFEKWRQDLKPFGTGWEKPHFTEATHIIVPFMQLKSAEVDDNNYYPRESVGLATGILLSALQISGVATLIHTPHNMTFLNAMLGRPASERPFVLVIAGLPKQPLLVPNIRRREFDESVTWL